MYNRSTIQTAATNLVGWSQSNDSLYNSIGRKTSDSGYYVNELPGITVDMLNYVNDEKTDISESNVSDYIAEVHDGEILKVVDMLISKQKTNLNTKELLQYNTMIQQMDDLESTLTKNGRFVGYAITPRESNTITSKILSVGFMSSAADSFTLYLFDSSHKTAIQSKTITTTAADTINWTTLDWDISFDREAGSAGQRYFIGYFENDVTADMYEIDWTHSHAHVAQRVFGRYMGIAPVRFNSGTLNGTNIPSLQYFESSINCKSSGFNLRFNTKCDITKVLEENIVMFGEALQYKIAIRIMEDALAYTTLNNVTNAQQLRKTWEEMVVEYRGRLLGGFTEAGIPVKGLLDHLSFDFSTMDAICLKNLKGQVRGVAW
jgi:hypothetical protein